MDILNSVTVDLPATRTYARREAQWFGKDANGFAGVILRLWCGRRAGSKMVERDLYQVIETDPPVGVMARAFVFLNMTDPEQQFPYKVLIGANHSCTCDAGRAKVPSDKGHTDGCKHRDSMREAIDSGFWDGTDDDAAPECYVEQPGEATAYELEAAHA